MRFTVLAAALLLGACGGGEPAPANTTKASQAARPTKPAKPTKVARTGPDAKAGEKVYKQYCITCHQEDGSGKMGDTQMAASFRDDPTRLAKPDSELLAIIEKGKQGEIGQMPSHAHLKVEQREDALAYIRSKWGKATEEAAPEG